ncbi:MAG: cell division protein FtsZ, partial [Candidatus Zixiibacteriota bacterium]
GARGVLINVTGGENMTLFDVNTATSIVYQAAGSDANIIFGAVIDPTLTEQMRVTVIATGFGTPAQVQPVEEKEVDFIPATPGKVMSLFPEQKEYPVRTAVGGNGRGRLPVFEDENRKIPAYIRRLED